MSPRESPMSSWSRFALPRSRAGRQRYLGTVEDKPEVRIGTSEREQAQSALGEHFSQGRLDITEFEERSSLATGARTVGDLAAVFLDLPGGLPAALSAPRMLPGRRVRRRVSFGALRATLAVVVMLLLLLGVFAGHGWWLFPILAISGAARNTGWAHSPHRLDGSGFHQR